MSDSDFELTRRFAELRAEDEANAPSFEAVRAGGRRDVVPIQAGASRPRWIVPAILAAAAAALAGVWFTSRVSARNDRARLEVLLSDSSMQVFRWTMPTDGLLTSARRTLQAPALSGSVLDAAAVPIPGTPFKGD
jgi:hypothetical protein